MDAHRQWGRAPPISLLALAFACLGGAVTGANAQAPDPPADEWRHEKIVQVVPADSLSWHVDTHCLAPPVEGAAPDEVVVLRFRVGRAHYYQAFSSTPELMWHVGDEATFVPTTCHIKRYAAR